MTALFNNSAFRNHQTSLKTDAFNKIYNYDSVGISISTRLTFQAYGTCFTLEEFALQTQGILTAFYMSQYKLNILA
jgi:hypothetical protein